MDGRDEGAAALDRNENSRTAKDHSIRGALFKKISDCTNRSVVFIRGGAGGAKPGLDFVERWF